MEVRNNAMLYLMSKARLQTDEDKRAFSVPEQLSPKHMDDEEG